MTVSLHDLLQQVPKYKLEALIAREGQAGRPEFLRVLYDDINSAIHRMESHADKLQKHTEEQLTQSIAAQLSAVGYDCTCETDHRGHVDLHVTMKPLHLTWLAEAKVHSTYDHLKEGMLQLLDRYSSGREEHAGFLIYIRNMQARKVVEAWRDLIIKEALCQLEGMPTAIDERYQFVSRHVQSSDVILDVQHFSLFLHYRPTDKSARESKTGLQNDN